MIWVLVDRLKLVLVVGALLSPFVALGVGLFIAHQRSNQPGRSSVAVTALRGFGLGLLSMPFMLYLAFSTPPPGEGVAARDGYRRGAVMSAALDRFREAHGEYPDSLAALVPSLLPAIGITKRIESQASYPLEYARTGAASYTLSFRYVGPGMNRCTFESATKRWSCSGYF